MAARSSDDESEHSADEQRPALASGSDDSAAEGNEAWADVLGKLLHTKAPRTKTPILFKAKKDGQQRRQKPATVLEIVGDGGEVKEQETQKLPDEPEFLSKRELRERKEKKRQWEEMSRTKPVHDEVEKRLRSIATRGVVQLFNAVKTHQKEVDEKLRAAGQSETKRDKVLKSFSKGAFLDMLKEKKEKSSDKQQSWGVLRDDFMLGAEMKDWDKEEEIVS
ncbi:RRP15-like protein [Dermacentor variabilis]|uniref:RRP15-like protein n=1 Tax=Dermacentor variabilis TaxID=34621 RepID=UPI003F5C5F43